MGLYLVEKLNNDCFLGIWKKEEELPFLLDKVSIHPEEKIKFDGYTNNRRKIEWLSTRLLLADLLPGMKPLIKYKENGKPWIEDSDYKISISHSKHFICILLSKEHEPGIDVEHIAERVLKVKHKFLSDKELAWCSTLEQFTICWSAKEAIFKTIGEGVDFKDILITNFNMNVKGSFNAQLICCENEEYQIQYRIIEHDVLTYTLK